MMIFFLSKFSRLLFFFSVGRTPTLFLGRIYTETNMNVLFTNICTSKVYSTFSSSKICIRSYHDAARRVRPKKFISHIDLNDTLVVKNTQSLSGIYLEDLDPQTHKRNALLSIKDQKRVKKYVYGMKH